MNNDQKSSEYSDFYKMVFGFRPSLPTVWKEGEWESEIDALNKAWEYESERRACAEKHAIAEFESTIASCLAHGAPDRGTAIRWLKDLEVSFGDEEYFEYIHGLPYGYLKSQA